ncbi:flagellar biosynthesis protein FlhG [Gracilibacillus orientalis]|uniref:Flagellar biosynthesis protein FlhG n=1 Tax=Gracilibacillus orientalis TaxID=334253 RepID=A0A1I4PVX8_9BACI|nr:MinD/ParA family protein [Gracilibacillus orientalis]SFM31957.1 flagellar biosynthesis protein FlhG [Gracilibacillus orientalis]
MTDQAAKLRQKLRDVHSHYHAKTMAIVSGKGGVGKSNIALNFSLSLASKGKKVLLFDLDVGMGNIDILLGKSSNYSIINLFENKLSIYDIIEVGPNSLSYIAGGSGQEHIFYLDEEKLQYFIEQLELLLAEYDYIIFDLGAGVTRETIHYILAVDECILVTTPEPTAMTDAYSMIKQVLLQQPIKFQLIVNRSKSKKQSIDIMNRMNSAVKRFLDHDVIPLGTIPDDSAVTDAVLAQQPFIIHNPKSKASVAIENVSNHYLGEPSKKSDNSGFLKRLRKLMTER